MTDFTVQDYCHNVEAELSSWKSKLTAIDSTIQRLPCGAKEKMLGNIEELHMTMAELDDRISGLKTSCPTEWNPVKEEISGTFRGLEEKFNFATNELADYDFGG